MASLGFLVAQMVKNLPAMQETQVAASALTKHLITWLLGPGKGTECRPNKSAPLRTIRVPEPEWLRPGRCMQPRASLGQFPAEQPTA